MKERITVADSSKVGREGRSAPKRSSHRPATDEKTRILVVEDDLDARELLQELLSDTHVVLLAENAEVGLELARTERPDAILLDLYLPGMDGFQALQALQQFPQTASVPVLFLSAGADERSRVRGLELGAADFVSKPYSGVELLARVRKALRAASYGAHLRAMAETDALTGLPNFRALLARLDEEIKRATRYRHPLSVVMVDLDNLKNINDELGHAAGNAAIVALSHAITAQLRETDFAARYGGDEFVLVLPHALPGQARELAERLRRALRDVRFDGHSALRGSFGISSMSQDDDTISPDALLQAADAALYRAKREGRDRIRTSEDEGGQREPHIKAAT